MVMLASPNDGHFFWGFRMKKILVLAAALGAAMLPLSAMANRPGSWFIRAEAGNTKHDYEHYDPYAFRVLDDKDSAFSLRGGYYYTPNFGFEVFYSDFGSQKYFVSFPSTTFDARGDGTLETVAVGVGMFGKKNFGQDDLGFYVSGRAGVLHAKTEGRYRVRLTQYSDDDSWNNAYAGIGIGYDFNPNFGLGLGYDYAQGKPELYGTGEAKIKLTTLSLGLEYRF